MTNCRIGFAAIGAALLLACTGGTAEAAKGVKKNTAPDAQRVVTGQIVNVTYNNGGGSIFLKVPVSLKQLASNQNAAGVGAKSNQSREFLATSNTRLINHNGTLGNPSSLKRGVRVRLLTTGNNTSAIQILASSRMRGRVVRVGANAYRPHLMSRHQLHPHHPHHHHRR